MNAEDVAHTLNEAITIDPNLISLFTVMVPCQPIVGKLTPIELMAVSDHIAMANVLGILNATFTNERIYLSRSAGGKVRFKVHTLNVPSNDSD
jgi:hypothetical protein